MATTAYPTTAMPATNSTATNSVTTHPYTCNACGVAFKSSDLQRVHMQTDWHRYNLKRRIASLPPLSSQVFNEKVLANQATAAATAARAQFEKTCAVCSRTYFSENAFNNHLASGKHRAKVLEQQRKGIQVEAGEDFETESMISSKFSLGDSISTPKGEVLEEDAERELLEVVEGLKSSSLTNGDPIPARPTRPRHSHAGERPNEPIASTLKDVTNNGSELSSAADSTLSLDTQCRCLFCTVSSETAAHNVKHMTTTHSLFIPESSYLVDLSGLISYLHEKVYKAHECLYCGKYFQTTTGVQGHMRDKGHTMIAFEEEEDQIWIGQFYDFSSTWDDEEDEMSDEEDNVAPAQGGTKLGARRAEAMLEDKDDDDDGDWEDDGEDDTSDTSTEDGKDRPAKRTKREPRTSFKQPAAYVDDTTLYLPSGRTAGHRSLARYYRQNLHNYPGVAERTELAARPRIASRTASSRDVDGDTNMNGETASTSQANGERQLARRDANRQLMSRANGGIGLAGVDDYTKRAASKMEDKERGRAKRAEERYRAGNERRNNFQKHFRDPLLQ